MVNVKSGIRGTNVDIKKCYKELNKYLSKIIRKCNINMIKIRFTNNRRTIILKAVKGNKGL